jgi:hypothetical protein
MTTINFYGRLFLSGERSPGRTPEMTTNHRPKAFAIGLRPSNVVIAYASTGRHRLAGKRYLPVGTRDLPVGLASIARVTGRPRLARQAVPTVGAFVVIGRPGIANAFPIGGPARTKVFVNFGRTVKSYDRARRSSKSYGVRSFVGGAVNVDDCTNGRLFGRWSEPRDRVHERVFAFGTDDRRRSSDEDAFVRSRRWPEPPKVK